MNKDFAVLFFFFAEIEPWDNLKSLASQSENKYRVYFNKMIINKLSQNGIFSCANLL